METLNSFTKKEYTVLLIKVDTPILGGSYIVELSKNDEIIREKIGLCLGAANEYFVKTVNQLNQI